MRNFDAEGRGLPGGEKFGFDREPDRLVYDNARIGAVVEWEESVLVSLVLEDGRSADVTINCGDSWSANQAVEIFSMWLNLNSLIEAEFDASEGAVFSDHEGLVVDCRSGAAA